jgi:hypothetical protein
VVNASHAEHPEKQCVCLTSVRPALRESSTWPHSHVRGPGRIAHLACLCAGPWTADVLGGLPRLQRRPWSEITDKTAYSKPANVTEATSRIRKNLTYFKVNYLLFVLGAVVTCLLTHPLSLFLLGGLGSSWVYLFAIRSEPLVIQVCGPPQNPSPYPPTHPTSSTEPQFTRPQTFNSACFLTETL